MAAPQFGGDRGAEAHTDELTSPARTTRGARWLEALTAGGVEQPRPLPDWARPLVRNLFGNRRLPTVAYGPATRRALRVAGASAATWAGVVHLPRPPRETPTDLETIAHEVTHVAQGFRSPRFFEGAAVEAGERDAASVGRLVRRVAERSDPSRRGLAARTAESFRPSAGSTRLSARRASTGSGAISGAKNEGHALGQRRAAEPGETLRRRRPVGPEEGGPGAARPFAGAFTARGRLVARQVDHSSRHETAVPAHATAALPVGGARAVMRALSTRSVVGAFSDLGDARVADRAQAAAAGVRNDAIDHGARAATGLLAPIKPAAQATSAVHELRGSAAGTTTDTASQVGDLIEAIEERVLVELERRGGRFAGTF